MELELVLKKELLQSGCELAPEDATQRGDGQEESSRGGDPSGAIERKTASRNDVVDVRMMLKVLSPSVQHAKKPDVCAQMLRVAERVRAASLHWLGTADRKAVACSAGLERRVRAAA